MELREYQKKAISDIKEFWLKGGKHCILQAPTGSGKTVIFSEIAKKTAEKGKKIIIFTDREELLLQTNKALFNETFEVFNIRAGIKYVNNQHNIYVAMSQTFKNRIKLKKWQEFLELFDLIILDECHKQEFNYLFESKILKNKYVTGFTATPRRAGNMRQLGLDYEKIISTVEIKELIDNEYLVDAEMYGIESNINFQNIAIDNSKGDFQIKSMFENFNSTKLYSGVVKNWLNIASNKKTLVFCVNIEHAILTALEFKKSGISCKYIVSGVANPKMKENANAGDIVRYNEKKRVYDLYLATYKELSGDRKKIFDGHKNNEFKVLINASIATTGYDDPEIECIILNRATISLTLFLQMIGRGSRISPNKKNFIILDFGENIQRLGTYSEKRLWSVWHEKTSGKGLPPIKNCGFDNNGKPIITNNFIFKGCNRPILASYQICPFCGFQYPKAKAKEVILKKINVGKNIREMNIDELYEYWKEARYSTAWLWRQLYYRGGENAIHTAAKKYGWSLVATNRALLFISKIKSKNA